MGWEWFRQEGRRTLALEVLLEFGTTDRRVAACQLLDGAGIGHGSPIASHLPLAPVSTIEALRVLESSRPESVILVGGADRVELREIERAIGDLDPRVRVAYLNE